jgi:hypothetical protein
MKSASKGRLLQVFVLAAGLGTAGSSLAQGSGGERSSDEGWAPVKHLTFTPEEIEGGTFAPDGTRIESILPAEHPSLIELREGFEAEIVKMLEDM